jgi:hypothetical protein
LRWRASGRLRTPADGDARDDDLFQQSPPAVHTGALLAARSDRGDVRGHPLVALPLRLIAIVLVAVGTRVDHILDASALSAG